MKAALIRRFGGPEVLELADVEPPVPGPGEVLLRVQAAGVNFVDLRTRAGRHLRQPALPAILGNEAIGTIEALGSGTDGAPPLGSRVMALDVRGAYAEYATAPAHLVAPVSEDVSAMDACALPVNYLTAWVALVAKGGLADGETVLVHAAGGGVGSAAVQLARALGAHVAATASSADKLAYAGEQGAEVLVNYIESDFVPVIRQALGADRPLNLVLDSLGGDTLVRSLALLAPWGRLVGFGQTGEQPATLDSYAAIPFQLDLRFFSLGAILVGRAPADRALVRRGLEALLGLWREERIRPRARTVLPLAEAGRAHALIGSRASVGKVVLVP